MPNVRNILPKKDRETGGGHEMRPSSHNWEAFFESHFPRRWMEGFFEPHEWKRPVWGEFGETFGVWPKIDVLDKEDAIIVRAEMPGVKKEDLEVTIAGDRLTFAAKRAFEEEEKKEDFFRSEMSYGQLYRVIPLPVEVKSDKARASMKDGVVEVLLPKVEAVTPHTVKVA